MKAFLERAVAHLPALRRSGRRLTRNEADAEDLAQETLARAIEKQATLRDPERIGAWLHAMQHTIHLNSRRGLRPRLEVLQGGLSDVPEPVAESTPESEIAARTLAPELDAALQALPPAWREALWLREVEELSYEDIARAQRCPVGTVRSRLARARQALQQSVPQEDDRGRM